MSRELMMPSFRILLPVLLAALAWCVQATPSVAAKRVALVVGVDRYPNLPRESQLGKAVADAEAVGDTLTKMGFDVTRAANVDRAGFYGQLDTFARKIEPGDTAFFFFAGHGVALKGTNLLALADVPAMDPSRETLFRSMTVAEADIIQTIRERGARLAVVVLDACRNNPFENASNRTAARSAGMLSRGLAEPTRVDGVFSIYSAGIGQEALDALGPDDRARNSVFTRVFVEHLAMPGLHLGDLAVEVREKVAVLALQAKARNGEPSPHEQNPGYYDQTRGGRVYLSGLPTPVIAPARPVAPAPTPPAPPAVDFAQRDFEFTDRINTREAWLAFLKVYPSGVYSERAQSRLAALIPPPAMPAPTPTPAPIVRGSVKLGVAGPMSGPNAAFGEQIKNGVEQAVRDINAAGGINGQTLQIVVGDDASDPRQGVSVANKFASEGVKMVVGHFNSGISIPASEVYQEAGIVQVTPSSTNPRFTERGMWNTFRTCGRDDQQGKVAGEYLSRNFSNRRVAIVHDKTPYGKGLADETKIAINARGLREVLYEGVNNGEKDYSALVSRLQRSAAQIVYFGGLHTEAGLIIRQMRDQGLNVPLMSGDGIVSAEFVSIAGPGADGTLMTFAPDPRKNPNAQDVVRKFRAKNFEPEAYTLYSYAAVQVLVDAAKKANSTDGRRISDVVRQGQPFKTVIGDISYDKKGDVTRPDYVMYVWRKGADGKIDYSGNETSM